MSYDAEADVLYVNFKKPSEATDSELTDDDVIIRYEGEEVIGLHYSARESAVELADSRVVGQAAMSLHRLAEQARASDGCQRPLVLPSAVRRESGMEACGNTFGYTGAR